MELNAGCQMDNYEWEDVPLEPTSVALANLKTANGCACEDIPDIAWNGQYYCIRCRANDKELKCT